MSAHLSLRRDFFLSRVGFGIGLTARMHFTGMLDGKTEAERCVEGGGCETEIEYQDDNDDNNDGFYSLVLMPMIYVAF